MFSLTSVRVNESQKLVVHRFRLRFCAFANGFGRAVAKMVAHQRASNGAKRFLNRGDLDQDVGAVTIFRYHPFDAADLALDAAESPHIGGANLWIDSYGLALKTRHSYTPRGHSKPFAGGEAREAGRQGSKGGGRCGGTAAEVVSAESARDRRTEKVAARPRSADRGTEKRNVKAALREI